MVLGQARNALDQVKPVHIHGGVSPWCMLSRTSRPLDSSAHLNAWFEVWAMWQMKRRITLLLLTHITFRLDYCNVLWMVLPLEMGRTCQHAAGCSFADWDSPWTSPPVSLQNKRHFQWNIFREIKRHPCACVNLAQVWGFRCQIVLKKLHLWCHQIQSNADWRLLIYGLKKYLTVRAGPSRGERPEPNVDWDQALVGGIRREVWKYI